MSSPPNRSWRIALVLASGLLLFTGCGQSVSEMKEQAFRSIRQALGSADFVVSAVTTPPSATPGSPFTATLTVCNVGEAGAPADVALHLSTDAALDPGDFFAGSAPSPYLNPGECAPVTVSASAYVPDGAYYPIALADPNDLTPENDEGNNTFAGQQLGIGYMPDFKPTSVTGPKSVTPGSQFSTTVVVCNQGTQPGNVNVEVFLSPDELIDSTDSFVGAGPASFLNPGDCANVVVNGPAYPPPGPGPFHVGVMVDRQGSTMELIETNNVLAGYLLGIGYNPDFVASSVTGPNSAVPGNPLSATVVVCNQGTSGGSPSLDVFLSDDATITSTDAFVGSGPVPYLNPGDCAPVSVSGSANPAGPPNAPYYLGAIVDAANYTPELNELNNVTTGNQVGIGYNADFVVSSVTGPASAMPGNTISATVVVCNQGTSYGSAEVDVFLSADTTTIGPPSDGWVGSAPTPHLGPGECAPVVVNGPAYPPPPPGPAPTSTVFYLGAIVDRQGYFTELNENNNTAVGGAMGVGYDPDFVATSVTGPVSAAPGGTVSLTVMMCNQGTYGGSTSVGAFLSADSTITSADSFINSAPTPYLGPGECAPVTLNGPAYPPGPLNGPYYLGAIVDAYNSTPELIESNNTTTGSVIGIGNNPDFVVSSVTGPPSATPGSTISATVVVCNQGTTGGSTQVHVGLSSDTVIGPPSDTLVGSSPVPHLDPGSCAQVTVSGSANPPPGPAATAYFLGAIVDGPNMTPELIESNNTNPGSLMGLGYNPDFVATSVTGPSSTVPSGTVEVSVVVCNQGTSGGGTQVDLFISADTTITQSTDPFMGAAPVPFLNPGDCATVTVHGMAYPPGPSNAPYYLGVIVDKSNYVPELLETNNTTLGGQVGVGYNPDFIASSVTGPASAMPGANISTTVVVCNQGTYGGGTSVDVFLSADTAITQGDGFVGSAQVPNLNPGECTTVTVNGPAYPPPGSPMDRAYYLGAIVDRYASMPELIETNNTLAGSLVGIGNKPDFTATSVTGPASAVPGSPLSATVVVCNQGTSGGSTQVEVLLSPDAVIAAPSDSLVGSVPTPYLSPGACVTVTVSGPAYPTGSGGGAYYLGAVLDRFNSTPELIESNNATTGDLVGIGNNPDFIASSVTGPNSVTPGGNFSTSVVVCNQGTTGGGASVDVFLSADNAINAMDGFVGSAPVPFLNPGDCATVTVNGNAYPPPGSYGTAFWVGAIVDRPGSNPELIESNNTKTGNRMGVGYDPDFVVSSVTGPNSATPGNSISTSVVVCNQGTSGGGTDVNVFLSTDKTITSADSFVGSAPVPYLAPGACATLAVSGPAYPPGPSNAGYYLGAFVDPYKYVPELIEGNNDKAGTLMGIGYAPDFVANSVTGPNSVTPGGSAAIRTTVCNRGTTVSSGGTVEVYLSADKDITPTDSFVNSMTTLAINPGSCVTVTVNGPAYPPGPSNTTYYVGAILDRANNTVELIETNNTRAGSQVGIGNLPDLVPTRITAPASVTPGGSAAIRTTVCNRGTTVSSGGTVEVYLSADTNITTTDGFVGSAPLPSLNVGGCTTVTVNSPVYPPPGASGPTAFYLGAIVDRHNSTQELNETNNTFTGGQIGVGYAPDLYVSSLSAPSTAYAGSPISVSAYVCNQGTTSGGSPVDVFLSRDTTLDGTDFLLGSVPGPYLNPGSCAWVSVSGYANLPYGTYYVGAIADRYNNVVELIETNNSRTGSTLRIQ